MVLMSQLHMPKCPLERFVASSAPCLMQLTFCAGFRGSLIVCYIINIAGRYAYKGQVISLHMCKPGLQFCAYGDTFCGLLQICGCHDDQ